MKPLVCTFLDLAHAFQTLHMWDKRYVSRLHDVWKLGAPTPDSRILVPSEYDERKRQPGNVEKRVVFPSKLAQWILETSAARGTPYTPAEASRIINGDLKT